MTRYAYVEKNNVRGVYDKLPTEWKNISNFHLLSDEEVFKHGFIKIKKAKIEYNPETEVITEITYSCIGDAVIEHVMILPKPEDPRDLEKEWEELRAERNKKIVEMEWRYMRSQRQIRMGLKPDDSIEALDRYIQALADITNVLDPRDVVWPVYGA